MAALSRAFSAQAALADGDLVAAQRAAGRAVTAGAGWYSMWALITRARVALVRDEPDQAERDAHDALACAAELGAHLGVADILECLAVVAGDSGSPCPNPPVSSVRPAPFGNARTRFASRSGTRPHEASVANAARRLG